MADYDLDAAMSRLIDMQKEAIVSSAANVNAVKHFPYQQESFPYWTNRITGVSLNEYSDDVRIDIYEITGRLVVAHQTEGYEGTPYDYFYTYIPLVLTFFEDREFLTSTNFPTKLDDVWNQETGEGCVIASINGPGVFLNSGTSTKQLGVEFVFSLPLHTLTLS